MKEFKKRVKIRMAELELNQVQLAQEYGCHKTLISNVLNGRECNKKLTEWLCKRLRIRDKAII